MTVFPSPVRRPGSAGPEAEVVWPEPVGRSEQAHAAAAEGTAPRAPAVDAAGWPLPEPRRAQPAADELDWWAKQLGRPLDAR